MKNIHYHGSPMWGNVKIDKGKKIWCGDVLYKDSCALVSYAHERYKQIKKISPICKSLILDCGAFTFYQRGIKTDSAFWAGYYSYVLAHYSLIDWFVIPDVIGGGEKDNDMLLKELPASIRGKGVPVWHSDESMDRLERLCSEFGRVCVGLVREHKPATSKEATRILTEAFECIYIKNNFNVKIHGLAMLDGRVLGKFPFDSADSSFVATNVPKMQKQMPEVQCKLARTAIYKNKIESVIPPTIEGWTSEILGN